MALLLILLSIGLASATYQDCRSPLSRNWALHPRQTTCIPLQEAQHKCARFGYPHAMMPNLLNHHDADEAADQLGNYGRLLDTECSPDLLFLLCLYHFPICMQGSELGRPVLPCRGLCTRVRNSCSPILARHDIEWPVTLDCSSLPNRTENCEYAKNQVHQEVCVSEPNNIRISPAGNALVSSGARSPGGEVPPSHKGNRDSSCTFEDIESEKCKNECRKRPTQSDEDLEWAMIANVTSFKINLTDCDKATYDVNVIKVLHGLFNHSGRSSAIDSVQPGQSIRIRVHPRNKCVCPHLQLPNEESRNIYFLAGRYRKGDRYVMKPKDVSLVLPHSWNDIEGRRVFRDSLNRYGLRPAAKRTVRRAVRKLLSSSSELIDA